MKKCLLLVSALSTLVLANAQNQALSERLEAQKVANEQMFQAYIQKNPIQNIGIKGRSAAIERLQNSIYFFAGGRPFFIKDLDSDQIINTNADFIQKGQISGLFSAFNGEGTSVTVFDGGRIYGDHPDFSNPPLRVTNMEAATIDFSGHATSVTGILGASGHNVHVTEDNTNLSGNTAGFMNKATFLGYSFNTSTPVGATGPKTLFQKIADSKAHLSNHSYGTNMGWDKDDKNPNNWEWNGFYDPATQQSMDFYGTYLDADQTYDDIVYSAPNMILAKATGNEFGEIPPKSAKITYNNGTPFPANATLPPANCSQGYDCISAGSLAKNIIVVGAAQKIAANNGRYLIPENVIIADYSSVGPRDDGAIKPDITGIGSNVFAASWTTDKPESYVMISGTSMASPNVLGVIGLWDQIYKILFTGQPFRADLAKTLMIHSANEAGELGPDPVFGWGLINGQKGAEYLVQKSNGEILFEEESLQNKVNKTRTITASGTEPLKVTISWIDPSFKVPSNPTYQALANNRTSRLVNDLDLRIIDTSTNTTYYPWKLNATSPLDAATTGDNTVDNVEQVIVNNPTANGTYQIIVSNKGNLVDNSGNPLSAQNFSILVTGVNPSSLATNEVGVADQIQLYPSVARDVVNLSIPVRASDVAIFDMSGKLIKTQRAAKTTALDVSSLAPGLYMVTVKTEKGVVTKKFIKE